MDMALAIREAAPPASEIVCGSTFGDGMSVIIIPAGRVWSGNVALSAYAAWSPADPDELVTGAPTITVQGAGAKPESGSIIAHLYVYMAKKENPVSLVVAKDVVIAATTDQITLQLNVQGASGATAVATGQLL